MESTLRTLVGSNVRAERTRRCWSQTDLAEALGVSQTTVSNLEAGRRSIDVDELLALCRALQVSLGRLLIGASTEQLAILGIPGRT